MIETELETVECPLCGPSQTTIWLDDGKPTKYIRCAACGTVFASPRLAQTVRHARTDASWSYSPKLLSFEANRRQALKQDAEFIQEYVQEGRLLDVGCSSGDFFEFFPSSRWEKHGIELSSSAALYAANAHAAHVLPGTLHSADWPGEYFDLVSMIDMFYYVDDPKRELLDVRRILKPTGILAIEITGQAYMFFRSRGIIALLMEGHWSRLSSDSHLFWFNPTGLQQLLRDVGFMPAAWRIVPGPTRSNRFSNFVSSTYYRAYSTLAGQSMKMLNWAPKYICLAKKG
jgi:SAM-dependent methyltransferase